MKISEYAVKNYQFTLVIFLMAVAVGVNTLLNMPRAEDPEINAPQFPIFAVYPGASPQDIEQLVVKPIENKVSELQDIKRIKASIIDGGASILVEYKYETNVEARFQELVREVNGLKSQLPADLYRLEVKKLPPSEVNVLQLALISENATNEMMKKSADKLKEALEKVPNLKTVEISGLPTQNVRVDLYLEKMAQMHIPATAVGGAIQSEMTNIPGGSIDAGNKSFNVKTGSNYKNIDEIKNTVVFSYQGKNILLKDIAYVHFDFAAQNHITRINGHRCVLVSAAQKPGFNISQSQEKYKPVITAFEKTLPANINMVTSFDQADNVNHRLGGLGEDFAIAILLVAITLLPLGGRAALIVMISIPLSLAMGVVLLNVMGYTLNQLSIVGLVVALGLLVDDSIVVVENIERWMREGYSRLDATLMGIKQIGMAVIGCTATLIVAFLPLVFLPEAAGEFIRCLPMAVICCVVSSMLVAITIIPFLSSKILSQHKGQNEGNLFLRLLKKGIQKTYAPFLNSALKHPWIAVGIAALIFAGSLRLIPVVGLSLFPSSEKPQFLVNIITPLQTNLNQTNEVTKYAESILAKVPHMKYYTANVGMGNPRIYYNVFPEQERTDYAQIFVQLEDDTKPSVKMEILENLRQQFSTYTGARIEVKNFEQGPPVVAPIEVRVSGENMDTLRRLAGKVKEMLEGMPAAMYINNPYDNLKTDIKVDINRDKASSMGIPTVNIDRTVRMAIAGIDMGTFNDADNKDYDILLTTPKDGRPNLDIFNNLYVNNIQGLAVPIKEVADLKLESSPIIINHFNKIRIASISAFVRKGYLTDNMMQEVIAKMDKMPMPEGYGYTMGGEYEAKQDSFGDFGTIIMVTCFLFIAVLILEFGTFKSTLIVLSVLPLGLVGAIGALLVTGNSLSFVALIGLIALAGIEVKNSILLVDFTNQLRIQGKSLEEAIREAGEIRFLPIILTSLTAIGGLIPIAISTNPLISPLAIVLIGGLISSTLLSRIVTPVVYKLMPPDVVVAPKPEEVV